MSEIEILNVQLKDIKNAIQDIINAMNNISEIDDLDAEYKLLDVTLSTLEETKTEIANKLEFLEEEAYYKENEEQWKLERTMQENEYWRDAI